MSVEFVSLEVEEKSLFGAKVNPLSGALSQGSLSLFVSSSEDLSLFFC